MQTKRSYLFIASLTLFRCYVAHLPPRAPELNPIELIFHILTKRMKGFKYRTNGPLCKKIVERVAAVLTDIGNDGDLILQCCRSCGYNV